MRSILGVIMCLIACLPIPVNSYAQGVARQTQSPSAPIQQEIKPAQIDNAGLLILIRQTLTALDLSNKSGNYGILRNISTGFCSG